MNQIKTTNYNDIYLDKLFFDIVENSWNEVVIIDPVSFKYKYLNKKVLENVGYSAEELLGKDIRVITPDFTLKNAREFVKSLINGEKEYLSYETTRKRKNGTTYPIKVNLRYLKYREYPVLVAINTDISEQKELKKNKNILVELLENSFNEICIFDFETLNVIYANNRALKNLGYSFDELKGKTPFDIDPNLTKEKAGSVVNTLIGKKSRFVEFNTKHQRKDGTTYPVKVMLQFSEFENKKVIFSIVTDLTEAQNAEDINYSLAQVLENSWNEIFIADENTLKFIYANKCALTNLGYTMDEIKELTVADINQNFDKQQFEKEFKSQTDSSEIIFETTHTRKDGTTCENELRISSIIFNNKPCYLAIAQNVTEKKQLHNLMVQNEKMMSVGNLAAGIAHEINNPLSAVLHSIQNINRRLSPEFKKNHEVARICGTDLNAVNSYLKNQKISHLLNSIRDAANRAAKITNDLLGFARQSDETFTQADITEILENAINLAAKDYNLEKKYDFRKIQIIRMYKKNTHKISCITSELEQVFLNLLINATHAMKNQDIPPKITLQVEENGKFVCIILTDNGPGIAENVKNKIFDPFFTTKKTGEGTGLGLSVCYFIVKKKHNGEIYLDTNYIDGARFVIKLPVERS